jgi:non-ribosomal peptide synthetase component F
VRYVHQLFGEQAWRHPHWTAIASGRTQLTYRQLNQSANKLAHQLADLGVGPETLVGVCLERSVETVRCLLAVLKAGGAYLPLDPSLPAARLRQMCAEARPLVILVNRADAGTFAETGARLLLIDECAQALADRPATAPGVSLTATALG